MKKYIRIQNDGEIDMNAFFLIGASTKRNQDKIGFFGSGLKYGLAVLLRNNIDVKIFSGIKEIKVTTKKKKFRQEIFNQIFINNKPTGLTIEMGIDWEAWYAVREIYSNSLDEKGSEMSVVEESEIVPDFDKTLFYIEVTDEIEKCLENWNEYFSNKRRDLVFYNDDLKAFYGGDNYIIYRRGIRCHKHAYSSLFHYDVKDIDINESRTLKHACDDTWRICEIVKKNANKIMIKKIYDNQKEKVIENLFRWREGGFNEDWLKVIGNRRIVIAEVEGHYRKEMTEENCLVLNKSLVNALAHQFKNRISIVGASDNFGEFHIIEKTEKQQSYLHEAVAFLKQSGYDIINNIEVAVFDSKETLGSIQGDTILIADRCFDEGKKKVCEAVFEEYVHIKYKYSDCSRQMQEFLFNKIITMMEDKQKVYF